MKTQITQEFLFAYFAGHVSALQKQMIEAWLKEPAHEEFFYDCLNQWEKQQPQYVTDLADSLATYRQFLARDVAPLLADTPVLYQPPTPVRHHWFRWAVAASILLTVTGWYYRSDLLSQTYRTGFGEIRTLQLADGSRVTLNANSSLRVPRLAGNDRDVDLTGEATFSVTHTKEHKRFVVHTPANLAVVVLGTEFALYTRPRQTRVVLIRGNVNVEYTTPTRQLTQVTMKPGDVVTLTRPGQLTKKASQHPEDQVSWVNQQFIFSDTSIPEICQMLQENYGVQIDIKDPQIAQQTLTGSFHARTADELLEAIAQILDIAVTHQQNRVLLTAQPLSSTQ